MAISLDLNANQINQALNAAYTGLVFAGTGIVRLTGSQDISGDKTFYGAVKASGSFDATGVSRFLPPNNSSVNLGSESLRFKTGFVSGIDALTGYIRTLKVDNLIATVAPNLVNATGNNLTISGQTNIQQAAISGNASIGGNATITGTLNVTGNTVLAGTVYSTGEKTFSGTLNQSGSLNVFGTESISGGLNITGDVFCTGNTLIKGNVSITGNHSQTGGFFLNTNNSNVVITGAGSSHKLSIIAPVYISGAVFHGGDFSSTGVFSHSGVLLNTGSLLNNGDFTSFGNATVTGNFAASKVFATGITATGTSSTPALIVQSNLTASPSGGAIEYSRGQFFATNELTGSATRALINQTYSYIAPDNFVFPFMTGGAVGIGIPYMFLGTTGIYLSTGIYDIKYNFCLRKGAGAPLFSLGLTGDGIQKFNYRNGLLTQREADTLASTTDNARANITGNSLNPSLAISGIGVATTANLATRYEFNATINVTGSNMKIRPFIHSSTSTLNSTGDVTGINFNMMVTTLSTGSGINQPAFSGPWSAS